jgi:hypothetical protein
LRSGNFRVRSIRSSPTYPDVKFLFHHPVVEAEKLGTVAFIETIGWGLQSLIKTLSILARLSLEYTGFDVDNFAMTLRVRLYFQVLGKFIKYLLEESRKQLLYSQLLTPCDAFLDQVENIGLQIVDTLGLKRPITSGWDGMIKISRRNFTFG